MSKIDQGYKSLAKTQRLTYEETQVISRKVYEAYGAPAFGDMSGNMLAELCNLAAEVAAQKEEA